MHFFHYPLPKTLIIFIPWDLTPSDEPFFPSFNPLFYWFYHLRFHSFTFCFYNRFIIRFCAFLTDVTWLDFNSCLFLKLIFLFLWRIFNFWLFAGCTSQRFYFVNLNFKPLKNLNSRGKKKWKSFGLSFWLQGSQLC